MLAKFSKGGGSVTILMLSLGTILHVRKKISGVLIQYLLVAATFSNKSYCLENGRRGLLDICKASGFE